MQTCAHTQTNFFFFLPQQIAKLVATEFFAQGDREKSEFKTQPIVSQELSTFSLLYEQFAFEIKSEIIF